MRPPYDQLGFTARFVYPTFWLCIVPAICLAAFCGLQWKMHQDIRRVALHEIAQDESLTQRQRLELNSILKTTSIPKILRSADTRYLPIHAAVPPAFPKYQLSVRLAIICCGACVLLPIAMLACIWLIGRFAMRSPQAYCTGIDLGLSLVRLFGVLSYLLQSVVALWLVLFFILYTMPLAGDGVPMGAIMTMVFAPLLGLTPVVVALTELFKPIEPSNPIDGTLLTPEHAPGLWQLVTSLCQRLEIAPPNQIIGGVSQVNFTDNTALLLQEPNQKEPRKLKGRTLYANLPLLKHLSEKQLASVLIADLVNFQDGVPNLIFKISQWNYHLDCFLHGINNHSFLGPIYYFSAFLQKALARANCKHGQTIRLKAIEAAGRHTHPTVAAEATVRLTAWFDLLHHAEIAQFQSEVPLEHIEMDTMIDSRFDMHLEWFLLNYESSIPPNGEALLTRPYPSLSRKLEVLGSHIDDRCLRHWLRQPYSENSLHLVGNFEATEEALWEVYEDRFRENHRQALLFRYLPKTQEERDLVELYFPAGEIRARDDVILQLDCEKIFYASWKQPIYFHELTRMQESASAFDARLTFHYLRNGKKSTAVLPISSQLHRQRELKELLTAYTERFTAAQQYQKSKPPRDTSLWQLVEDSLYA
ncbi:hypothetical protein AB1K70_20580 [Bremerella sp. JC770]|uniref:hypothetical protein n=1 Tax=Bremerella sp. JC770 TaxID=3232137 RepID=UPI0034581000